MRWHRERTDDTQERSPSRRLVPADRLARPVHRVPGSDAVFFTFDDGPHPVHTLELAEVLESSGHRGTFFCRGPAARRHRDVVARLVAAGHCVGSHSATHRRSRGRAPLPVMLDYLRGHRQVARVARTPVVPFRPPYGIDDRRARLSASVLRVPMVLWSCDSLDWQVGATAAQVVDTVTPELDDGAIVLFHDCIADEPAAQDRSHTVAAVAQLVAQLDSQGRRSDPLPGVIPTPAGAERSPC